MPGEYISMVISGVGCVVWYLLRTKDEAQAKSIDILFSKHDTDYAELQALKLQIASQHYVKGELDHKFDKLEGAFREGFVSLGTKFDRLGDVLVEHINQETGR